MRALNRILLTGILLVPLAISGCKMRDTADDQILLRWGVLDNHLEAGFLSRLVLVNRGSEPLESDWTIYFNFLRVVDSESVGAPLAIKHVNGDLYTLKPGPDFGGLAPGDSVVVEFMSQAWAVSLTDAPAGAYLVRSGSSLTETVAIEVEPFVSERQTDRGINDHRPVTTPEVAFERNRSLYRMDPDDIVPVTPTPASISLDPGEVVLTSGLALSAEQGLENEVEMLRRLLGEMAGISAIESATAPDKADIRLQVQDSNSAGKAAEAYSLTVRPEGGIEILGSGRAGVFYGIQSMLALIRPEDLGTGRVVIPAARIEDAPRFGYRGMHLDVARNFQPKEEILKLLDVMAFYKLNRFHFHLTDDEGWRLEIAGLPELTSIGAFRGHTTTERDHLVPSFGSGPDPSPATSHGSGYYTREEFKEILRFAHQRHIEVIPEIDVPGHARAAIVSMNARYERLMEEGEEAAASRYRLTHPEDRSVYMSVQHWNDNVIDVCMPSTYEFLEYVVTDLVDMYREADVPLTTIHTGGDEVPVGVWTGSPACEEFLAEEGDIDLASYFLDRLEAIISAHGLITAGWEEVALQMDEASGHAGKQPDAARLASGIRPYVWNSIWGAGSEDLAYRLANAGFKIVLSSASNFYFDLAYDKHPEEPGYYWAGYVDMRKPFELEPFDLYRSADEDYMGNPISPSAYDGREQLSGRGRENILGIQGQLWGENAKGVEVTEYLAFPRMIVLAERAWAGRPGWSRLRSTEERGAALDEAWNEFANRLASRDLPRLGQAFDTVSFRVPPPGAVVRDGVLSANLSLPGFEIRYTTDGSIPNVESNLYENPVEVTGIVRLRTFDRNGRGSRMVSVGVLGT